MKPDDYVLICPPNTDTWRMARLIKQLGPDANPLYEVDDGGDHHIRVLPTEIKPAPKFVGEQLVEILVSKTWTSAVYVGREGFLYIVEIGKKKSFITHENIRVPQTAVITSFSITESPRSFTDWSDIAGKNVKHRYHTTGVEGVHKTARVLRVTYDRGERRWVLLVITPDGAFDSWYVMDCEAV